MSDGAMPTGLYQQPDPKPTTAGKIGGIFATLLGAKHGENLRKEHNVAKFIMDELHDAATNPANTLAPETVDFLVGQAGKIFGKDMGGALKGHFDLLRAKREADRRQAMLPQQPTPPGAGAGGAATPPAPTVAPAPMPAAPAPIPTGQLDESGRPVNRLPQPPFDQGAPATGGAPQQQNNPVVPMVVGAVKSGAGFGGPMVEPPAGMTPSQAPTPTQVQPYRSLWIKSPEELRSQAAALSGATTYATQTEKSRAEREAEAAAVAQREKLFAPYKDQLTTRQWVALTSAQNITPEPRPVNLPGGVYGSSIPAGTLDADGQPIDPKGYYTKRVWTDGTVEYHARGTPAHELIVPDTNSPTGWSQVSLDRSQREMGRLLGVAPNPAFAATVTSHDRTGMQWVQVGDHWEAMPTHGTSTDVSQKQVPGAPGANAMTSGPPGTANAAPPAGRPPAQSGQAPRAVAPPASVGTGGTKETAAAWKMRMENQYTPKGADFMMMLAPRQDMINRLIAALEPYKNSDMPASSLMDRVMYAFGHHGDRGSFLSQLSLGSLAQAAALVNGTSRARQVLEKAEIHTPNAWIDSGKMMYGKLLEIRRNMSDMEAAVNKYEKKYPGLDVQQSPTSTPSNVPPIVQQSPSTGKFRYSLDGGKTWQPGKPPGQ